MIAIDAVKRTILLVNRFGLYLSVPAFLLIAYAYASSVYPQYRVTTKIALKNVSSDSLINGIKSKSLVQKALNALPFQASYYNAASPKTEIYGDALYAKFIFAGHHYAGAETWVRMETQDANSVILTYGDTSAYYEFNKPVSEFYGKFKVVQNPQAQYTQASYIVRIENPVRLSEQYYNSLRVKTEGDDNTLTVSVLSGNPKKGADFLNKLLQLYAAKQQSEGLPVGKFTMIEKPENNTEEASVSPFWIYAIALLTGLFIPMRRKIINHWSTYVWPVALFTLPKLVGRINHRIAFKPIE